MCKINIEEESVGGGLRGAHDLRNCEDVETTGGSLLLERAGVQVAEIWSYRNMKFSNIAKLLHLSYRYTQKVIEI